MAVRGSPGLKQLVGATGNQVIDLLGALEGRIANEPLRCLWCLNKFRCSLIFHAGFLLSRELSSENSENCGVLALLRTSPMRPRAFSVRLVVASAFSCRPAGTSGTGVRWHTPTALLRAACLVQSGARPSARHQSSFEQAPSVSGHTALSG